MAKYKWHIGLKLGELPDDFFRWDKERQFELLKDAAAKRPDAEKVVNEYNPHVVADCTVSLFEGGKWAMETHTRFGYAMLAEKMED